MKHILTYLYISLTIVAYSQSKTYYQQFEGKVRAFADIGEDNSPTIRDTTTNQSRIIKLAKNKKSVIIGFQATEDDSLSIGYVELSIYQKSKKDIYDNKAMQYLEFTSYICFDKNDYPINLLIAKDNKTAYMYYYFDNTKKQFLKSEKIILKNLENTNYKTAWNY